MGSDNLFHKRKARASTALQRKKHARARNKRFLIVCEGTKTEPYYFSDLLDDLQVPPPVVRIVKNDGVTPDRVVAYALELYDADAKSGDAYDTVYCVFDRDSHPTFDSAVKRTRDLFANRKPLIAITSTPCFEVWLLLHFGYTTQPFHAAGKKSVGDQVVIALKDNPGFGKYGKGQRGVYALLKSRLGNALENAAKLRTHCETTSSGNPATDIDQLILALRNLAA